MNKIDFDIEKSITRMCELNIGEFGIIHNGPPVYANQVVMGVHSIEIGDDPDIKYVSLTDPSKTWSHNCTLKVERIPVGTVLNLTVGEPE